jgi:mannosylglycerate hydrolase
MSRKTVHVIPHTHWDYEWYFTQPESSVQLVYHMDDLFKAFESGQINHYILDGQMSILDDYLELAPDRREELQHWIRTGHLNIGPWYTQTDQMIISGESIVRNLLLGIRSASHLGHCWMMGYVPDAFGQSMDMPKIYNGFGIRRCVFWRGLSSDQCASREFSWQSEDGSEVDCYQLRNGYYQAEPQIAGQEPDAIVATLAEGTRYSHIPLPYGADQIKVDLQLQHHIEHYNQQSQEEHQFLESTYDALFDAFRHEHLQNRVVQGEMLDAQYSKIHRSIYSTRYDHKQLNDQIETRLTLQLEPFMLMAHRAGIPYKQSMINQIWKNLIRCHAHDSAGGCNSDRTNQNILQRLIQADQMSSACLDYLVRNLSESMAQHQSADHLFLYNTLPYPRCERCIIGIDTASPYFTIQDEDQQDIHCSIMQTERRYRGTIRRNASEQDESLYYFHHDVELNVTLPALGYRRFHLSEQHVPSASSTTCHTQNPSTMGISNSHCQIEFANGQLVFTEQSTRTCWPDFLTIRDMGDDGDNYDYSAPEQDWIIPLDFSQATVQVQKSLFSQTLILEGSWLLPVDLTEREQQRASVTQSYRLQLTLTEDGHPLDIRLNIDNQAQDHRMQMVIHSDLCATDSIADTPFGTVTRPNLHRHIHDWREQGWKEEPSCIYPMLHHVSLQQDQNQPRTLTLFSCGIKEYEVIQPEQSLPSGESGQIALTLFRSVGWLGKPELQRRPGIASGQQFKYIPTPDSQLLQPLQFHVGLVLNPQFNAARLMKQWQEFAVPYLHYQQQQLNRFTNTMKYFGINPATLRSPLASSLFRLETPELVCSALKMAESYTGIGDTLIILRLYNPSSHAIADAGIIHMSGDFQEAAEVDLNEIVTSQLPVISGRVAAGAFAPKQIKTFRFARKTGQ